MIKAAILDDELHCVEVLQLLIEKYCPEIEVVRMFTDSLEALPYLQSSPPDLLFLDIEMPQLNGFDILEKLRPAPFAIIFTTAYNQYALKAFKYSAANYLLKPIGKQDLVDAVAQLSLRMGPFQPAQYDLLLGHSRPSAAPPDRIALSTAEGLQIVTVADIMHCESDGPYTHFYFAPKGKLLVSKTLKDADEVLTPCGFVRVHHSHLVNPAYVDRYIRGEGGEIVMRNGRHVPLARSKKQDFLALFSKI